MSREKPALAPTLKRKVVVIELSAMEESNERTGAAIRSYLGRYFIIDQIQVNDVSPPPRKKPKDKKRK